MKKEIKTISCNGAHLRPFSWEGSIIVYDDKYFEGLVRELDVECRTEKKTRMDDKDHPMGFIAGYIIENKIVTFDKFPEACTLYDDMAFLCNRYFPNNDGSAEALGYFSPIMPCGNCPSFYKSLYHNKDVPLEFDMYDQIKDMFPCEDDEIIIWGDKIKRQKPKYDFYTVPLNSELEYTVNTGLDGAYRLGSFGLSINVEDKIKFPEDLILDMDELEQRVALFKNSMREFDMYLYENISTDQDAKYLRILERLLQEKMIPEETQEEKQEESQQTEGSKKVFVKLKERLSGIFKNIKNNIE